MSKTSPIVVFLHGAGTGAWIWERVGKNLSSRSLALDLPLSSDGLGPNGCAQLVWEEVGKQGEAPIILVLHSWAGILAGNLYERFCARIQRTVFLSAIVDPTGGSFVDALPIPNRWITRQLMRRNPEGIRPSDKMIRREYCNDLGEKEAQEVVARFERQRPEPFLTPSTSFEPSGKETYILCARDKSVPPALQRKYAKRLGSPALITIDGGHLAMLSRPLEVAKAIEGSTSG